MGKRANEIMTLAVAATLEPADRDVIASGEIRVVEDEVAMPDGQPRVYLSTKAPRRDAQGRVVGVIGVSRDITERRRAETRLRQTRAELLHVSRLRRPREFVGRGNGDKRPIAVNALVEEAAPALVGARERGGDVRHGLSPQAPSALANRAQIQQVVVNLVRNAVEAMQDAPRRGLVVATAALGPDAMEIGVANSGPGLATGAAERLFEPLVSTERHGMGVGLSISRSILEQHGGRLLIDANPGGGTAFRVVLPASPMGGEAAGDGG